MGSISARDCKAHGVRPGSKEQAVVRNCFTGNDGLAVDHVQFTNRSAEADLDVILCVEAFLFERNVIKRDGPREVVF